MTEELEQKLADLSSSDLIDLLVRINRCCDNCLTMTKMPLPDSIHKDGLIGGMQEVIELTQGITH